MKEILSIRKIILNLEKIWGNIVCEMTKNI